MQTPGCAEDSSRCRASGTEYTSRLGARHPDLGSVTGVHFDIHMMAVTPKVTTRRGYGLGVVGGAYGQICALNRGRQYSLCLATHVGGRILWGIDNLE
jgi:hypothetical protein